MCTSSRLPVADSCLSSAALLKEAGAAVHESIAAQAEDTQSGRGGRYTKDTDACLGGIRIMDRLEAASRKWRGKAVQKGERLRVTATIHQVRLVQRAGAKGS